MSSAPRSVAKDRAQAIPHKAFLVDDAKSVIDLFGILVSSYCDCSEVDAGKGIHQKCTACVPVSVRSLGSSASRSRMTLGLRDPTIQWTMSRRG
jgi:hypothetical protein